MHLKIIPVPADGDCLYHSVIQGLKYHGTKMDISPKMLRCHVASVILKDPDLYDDLVTEWVDFGVIYNTKNITPQIVADRIINTHEWATSTVIHILAFSFNVKIVILEKIKNKLYPQEFPSVWKNFPETDRKITIFIHKTGKHFELLVPLENTRKRKTGLLDYPDSFVKRSKRISKRTIRGGGSNIKGKNRNINKLQKSQISKKVSTEYRIAPFVLGVSLAFLLFL